MIERIYLYGIDIEKVFIFFVVATGEKSIPIAILNVGYRNKFYPEAILIDGVINLPVDTHETTDRTRKLNYKT